MLFWYMFHPNQRPILQFRPRAAEWATDFHGLEHRATEKIKWQFFISINNVLKTDLSMKLEKRICILLLKHKYNGNHSSTNKHIQFKVKTSGNRIYHKMTRAKIIAIQVNAFVEWNYITTGYVLVRVIFEKKNKQLWRLEWKSVRYVMGFIIGCNCKRIQHVSISFTLLKMKKMLIKEQTVKGKWSFTA